MWTKSEITDQTNKVILITGANTGIGYETALALYEAGAHVILACRDLKKAEDAIIKLKTITGKGSLEAAKLDLSDLNSVKEFSVEFLEKHDQLHVLINNAGVMASEGAPVFAKTEQGYEQQFGVNFLGHFALTGLLYPLLKNTSGSRIVTLSSGAYLRGIIDFENLRSEKGTAAARDYAQSKLADMILAIELDRRIKKLNGKVLSIAAQPGANKTDLSRYMSKEEFSAAVERVGPLMDAWQGALPSLFSAVSPDAKPGNLYEPHENGFRGYPVEAVIKENALNETVAKKLWELAEKITGIQFPEN